MVEPLEWTVTVKQIFFCFAFFFAPILLFKLDIFFLLHLKKTKNIYYSCLGGNDVCPSPYPDSVGLDNPAFGVYVGTHKSGGSSIDTNICMEVRNI